MSSSLVIPSHFPISLWDHGNLSPGSQGSSTSTAPRPWDSPSTPTISSPTARNWSVNILRTWTFSDPHILALVIFNSRFGPKKVCCQEHFTTCGFPICFPPKQQQPICGLKTSCLHNCHNSYLWLESPHPRQSRRVVTEMKYPSPIGFVSVTAQEVNDYWADVKLEEILDLDATLKNGTRYGWTLRRWTEDVLFSTWRFPEMGGTSKNGWFLVFRGKYD